MSLSLPLLKLSVVPEKETVLNTDQKVDKN